MTDGAPGIRWMRGAPSVGGAGAQSGGVSRRMP